MNIMNKQNVILNVLAEELRKAGFRKKANTWYRESSEVISVVNLQKSAYGQQYYVNLAIYVKNLGEIQDPKEHQCHIRTRLSELTPISDRDLITSVFDLEDTSFTDEGRKTRIIEILEGYGLPFIESCSSLASLKEAYSRGMLSKALLDWRVEELISKN